MVSWKPDLDARDVRARLDEYENRYGVPSNRLAEAFRGADGELVESDDFHAWDELWTMWQQAVGTAPARSRAAG